MLFHILFSHWSFTKIWKLHYEFRETYPKWHFVDSLECKTTFLYKTLPFQCTVTRVGCFPLCKVFSTIFWFKEYNSKKLSKKLPINWRIFIYALDGSLFRLVLYMHHEFGCAFYISIFLASLGNVNVSKFVRIHHYWRNRL